MFAWMVSIALGSLAAYFATGALYGASKAVSYVRSPEYRQWNQLAGKTDPEIIDGRAHRVFAVVVFFAALFLWPRLVAHDAGRLFRKRDAA